MNNSIHRISLDIHDTGSQVSINAKKGDTARSIYITLQENSKPYRIADGCHAVFTGVKPDGNYLFNDCTIKDNVITYDFTEQTVPVVGQVCCEIILYDANNERITSPRFDIIVNDVVYNDEEIASSDEANALITATAEAKAITAEVEQKLANGEFVGEKGEKGEKGEQGVKGDKGDRGDDGKDAVIDQTYNPKSTNAQSGIAVAEGIAQLDLKGYEVIDDITISEGVRSVVFSNSSQKDYTEFFLICSMGVATDGKLICAIKMNDGNTYLAWKQLNTSAKTTENYLWWHYAKYIGKTGVQNNKNQYAWISQFPDTSITTQYGGIITQGISSDNKSQYCDISNGPAGNKSENYEISSVGVSSAFASGSRFILLGRGTRQ